MPYAPTTLAALNKLMAAIQARGDLRRAAEEWKQAYRLLQKTALPADEVAGVVGMRDVEALAGLIAQLERPEGAGAQPDAPDAATCARALQAFKRRFELAVLDEESKLGRNPLTKGAKSTVAGIPPPNDWPEPVWRELVRQRQLIYVGHGCYAPVK